MAIETQTAVFESVQTGVYVVLTFDLVDESGRVAVKCSVRSRTATGNQSVAAMARAQAVWQSWISRVADGDLPPLPPGWRAIDGAQEASTS